MSRTLHQTKLRTHETQFFSYSRAEYKGVGLDFFHLFVHECLQRDLVGESGRTDIQLQWAGCLLLHGLTKVISEGILQKMYHSSQEESECHRASEYQ